MDKSENKSKLGGNPNKLGPFFFYECVEVCCVTRVAWHGGDTLAGVEFKDADVFIRAAGGYVLTRRIKLDLPGRKEHGGQHTYREEEACGGWRVEASVTLSRLPSSLSDPL